MTGHTWQICLNPDVGIVPRKTMKKHNWNVLKQQHEILINLASFWKFMFWRVDQQPRLNFFFVGCPGRLFREDLGKICVFEKLGRKIETAHWVDLSWFIHPINSQIALNCGALQLHFLDLFHERCGALVAEVILAAESHFGHLWAIPNEGLIKI